MLSTRHRIPTPLIATVMHHGRRIADERLQLVLRSNQTDATRFSFIVSTKIDKRATHRNRIRRVLSESVRLRMDSIKPGVDCICIAKKGLADLKQTEVDDIVIRLLIRAELLVAGIK